jgi:hypothetical protein
MKKLIQFIIIAGILTSPAFALDFIKGSAVPDIHPRMLRKLLIQGKTSYEGAKIFLDKGVSIPSNYQKKWDEIKLSGGEIPKTGSAGDNVILIKSF